MYDAVAEAMPLAQQRAEPQEGAGRDLGRQRHQQPHVQVDELRQMIRETEVLVYAVGIDGQARRCPTRLDPPSSRGRTPVAVPAVPGRAPAAARSRRRARRHGPARSAARPRALGASDDRVNVRAARR